MKRILGALALVLISGSAFGADAVTDWVLPTERVDNVPLDVSELDRTVVERGTCNGTDFGVAEEALEVPAPGTTVTFSQVPGGTWCFRGYVVDTDGLQSGFSNVAQAVLSNAAPKSITITVTVP